MTNRSRRPPAQLPDVAEAAMSAAQLELMKALQDPGRDADDIAAQLLADADQDQPD
jgi:hypothetical protein